ncbi:hypothetical protein SteCoe_16222 [Stentor coeruleus]|uniref:Uncharacterized protein n=1 Tax=Stentor coeruleus TaxID=5963 RepID=A0A1R2C1X0_9CILI|nr:hypothetical protein SteCoe_16222 [Stentor coeruleus]
MENDIERPKLPLIVISSVLTDSKDVTNKSVLSDPIKEEDQEKFLVQELIKELNLEQSIGENIDPLVHDPMFPEGECPHCKLIKKVVSLQNEITKMNSDINCTHEILNMKKVQNAELKSTIKRLESSLTKNDGTILEQKESSCSCGSRCSIY